MHAVRLLPAAAAALVLAGCAGLPPPRMPSASLPPGLVLPEPPGSIPADAAREVALHAVGLVGTPYRHGGGTPQDGFDCSGLIGYAYRAAAGKSLPRTVLQLSRIGQRIHPAQARAGDLVFFDTTGPYSHAGIVVGGARFVHAPSTGGAVRIEPFDGPYWRSRLVAVVRP